MPPTTLLDRLLVVAEPWASLLVDGEKTWELRATSTKIRGPIQHPLGAVIWVRLDPPVTVAI